MSTWQLHDAKNRLSQLVDQARTEGPQRITQRGRETAVILSIEDYRRLTRPAGTLVDFLRQSPLAGSELDLARSQDTGRDIDL
jgi:prevent-host-death family protein